MRYAHWQKAVLLEGTGQMAEAAVDWDRALAMNDEKDDEPFLRYSRASAWVHAGQLEKVLAEIIELEKLDHFDRFAQQDLARVCALSAAKMAEDKGRERDPKVVQAYADRAVELLRKSVAKGYDDIRDLKSGSDWAVLRSRNDFQELLKEMESRQAKAKKRT